MNFVEMKMTDFDVGDDGSADDASILDSDCWAVVVIKKKIVNKVRWWTEGSNIHFYFWFQ